MSVELRDRILEAARVGEDADWEFKSAFGSKTMRRAAFFC